MIHVQWSMRRLKSWEKAVAGLVLLIAFHALVGFWVVPAVLKLLMTGKVSKSLGHPITVESVRFNPFSLRLSLQGLLIADPESNDTVASVDSFQINLQAASIFKRKLVAQEILVEAPFAHVIRKHDGCIAFITGAGTGDEEKQPDEPPNGGPPIHFNLKDIEIRNGALDLTDEATGREHRIRDLSLFVPGASSDPETPGWTLQPTLLSRIDGSPLVVYGSSQPLAPSLATHLNIQLGRVDLPNYLVHVPVPLPLIVRSSMLDIASVLDFSLDPDRKADLKLSGRIGVEQLDILDANQKDLIKFTSLSVPITSAAPLEKRVELGRVVLAAPVMQTSPDKKGKLNLAALIPPNEHRASEDQPADSATKPFFLSIEAFDIADGEVFFADHTPHEAVKTHLKDLSVNLVGFSTAGSTPAGFECSAKTEIGETLHAKGQISLQPLNVEDSVSLTGIDSRKYRPYYQNQLQFEIREGKIDASSRFHLSSHGGQMGIELSDLNCSVKSVRCSHSASDSERRWRAPTPPRFRLNLRYPFFRIDPESSVSPSPSKETSTIPNSAWAG
jgi:uncharacterized protein involved in outer membrane biogenesis